MPILERKFHRTDGNLATIKQLAHHALVRASLRSKTTNQTENLLRTQEVQAWARLNSELAHI